MSKATTKSNATPVLNLGCDCRNGAGQRGNEKKVALARENISRAGAANLVEVFHGDAFDFANRFDKIAFCFSDIEPPELNAKIYEIIVPRLVPGGWIVVDNVTSPRIQTELLKRAQTDSRVDSVLLPFPKGDLICRKC